MMIVWNYNRGQFMAQNVNQTGADKRSIVGTKPMLLSLTQNTDPFDYFELSGDNLIFRHRRELNCSHCRAFPAPALKDHCHHTLAWEHGSEFALQ